MMKNKMFLTLSLIFSSSIMGSEEVTSDGKSYDEFKDKNIEFSLDDGENESKFHFEDQNLINKRMKELEEKKANRLKRMNSDIAAEELSEAQANRLALKEKNIKLYDLRQKRLKEFKEHKEKVQGIFSLNHFHQYRSETNYHLPTPKAPEVTATRTVASVPEANSARQPAFIGRIPAENDIHVPNRSPQAIEGNAKSNSASSQKVLAVRKPQSFAENIVETAKIKAINIFNRIKSWFK